MILCLAKPWTTFVFLLNGYFQLALKTTQHLSFQITEVAAVSLPNIVWGYPYSQLILSDG